MMYSNKFVVSVKSNGKFLRENDENTLLLPFGSEYSLYLKNLNSRKAVVSISIDGQDVLDGNRIIVFANSYVELNGFMNGNVVKNNFRFIEKTKQIEDFRGNDPSDGLIRVEYWFEKEYNYSWQPTYIYYDGSNNLKRNTYGRGTRSSYTNCDPDQNTTFSVSSNFFNTANTINITDGITVKGNETYQPFEKGYIGETEESNVIILQLKGYKENQELVKTFISTRDKIICQICGEKNRSDHKFCTNCGTYLR